MFTWTAWFELAATAMSAASLNPSQPPTEGPIPGALPVFAQTWPYPTARLYDVDLEEMMSAIGRAPIWVSKTALVEFWRRKEATRGLSSPNTRHENPSL
jgi:hypothetical protein